MRSDCRDDQSRFCRGKPREPSIATPIPQSSIRQCSNFQIDVETKAFPEGRRESSPGWSPPWRTGSLGSCATRFHAPRRGRMKAIIHTERRRTRISSELCPKFDPPRRGGGYSFAVLPQVPSARRTPPGAIFASPSGSSTAFSVLLCPEPTDLK